MTKFTIILFFILKSTAAFTQQKDSTNYKLSLKNSVIPTSIIIIGLTQIGHESKELQADLQEDFPSFKSRLDDAAQYVPGMLALFSGSLNLNPQHHFKSRLIYATISYATMSIVVSVLKKSINETRPDNSGNDSFPSGHTAFSFTGAELFHQELKYSHPILSYVGYPFATGVGVYRLLNNKHYLSDVLVGAGIGILSTKLAYAIYHPKDTNKSSKYTFNITPSYLFGRSGLTFVSRF